MESNLGRCKSKKLSLKTTLAKTIADEVTEQNVF